MSTHNDTIGQSAPLLLTVEQAAQVLAISRSKIYALIQSGELPSLRIGGSRRVTPSAVRAFVEGLQRSATEGEHVHIDG